MAVSRRVRRVLGLLLHLLPPLQLQLQLILVWRVALMARTTSPTRTTMSLSWRPSLTSWITRSGHRSSRVTIVTIAERTTTVTTMTMTTARTLTMAPLISRSRQSKRCPPVSVRAPLAVNLVASVAGALAVWMWWAGSRRGPAVLVLVLVVLVRSLWPLCRAARRPLATPLPGPRARHTRVSSPACRRFCRVSTIVLACWVPP
mmetsp:Transcript_724/g.1538  ORF Transcript_724/g.1538 Transcript_724/m.1538 type:complete len:203 (+) Transcript_724:254-862(+)